MRLKVNILKGKIVEVQTFDKFLSFLKDGTHYIDFVNTSDLSSVEDYRKAYFYFRDLLWEDRKDYTKAELHDVIKQTIIPELWDDPDNFTVESPHLYPLTTKHLTQYGWKNFLDAVKEFAQNEFNIYL